VYAYRVIEDVTLQYGKSKFMNKDMENHPCLIHSKQKTEIIKTHVLLPKASILHVKRERERIVQVLDPKGLVGKYLGTQDLDTTQSTQLIMRVSKIQNLVCKRSH
jgi:hypothetical protein